MRAARESCFIDDGLALLRGKQGRCAGESTLRTDEHERVRANVSARGDARCGQSWAGFPGFRLARTNSGSGGPSADGTVQPISAVARLARAPAVHRVALR